MRIEHYPQEKLKKEILEISGKYLDSKNNPAKIVNVEQLTLLLCISTGI